MDGEGRLFNESLARNEQKLNPQPSDEIPSIESCSRPSSYGLTWATSHWWRNALDVTFDIWLSLVRVVFTFATTSRSLRRPDTSGCGAIRPDPIWAKLRRTWARSKQVQRFLEAMMILVERYLLTAVLFFSVNFILSLTTSEITPLTRICLFFNSKWTPQRCGPDPIKKFSR